MINDTYIQCLLKKDTLTHSILHPFSLSSSLFSFLILFSALATAFDEKSLFPGYILDFERKMKNYHAMMLNQNQVCHVVAMRCSGDRAASSYLKYIILHVLFQMFTKSTQFISHNFKRKEDYNYCANTFTNASVLISTW